LDIPESQKTWQEIKMSLILSLSNGEIFMDADLRWNGAINKALKETTFFAKEYSLVENSPYRQVLRKLGFKLSPDLFMLNVSFFTFGEEVVSSEFRARAWKLWNEYINILEDDEFGKDDRKDLNRVIEQFLISILVVEFALHANILKQSDKHLDGEFVESCYFNATGFTF
jgi:hypothetical protein